MKGPKRTMSSFEYSTLVVIGCMAAGSILMGIVTVTSSSMGLLGKIFLALFWLVLAIFCGLMFAYQLETMKKDEGEDDNEA